MPCGAIRRTPNTQPVHFPMVGEKGFLQVKYIGDDPDLFFGEVTNAGYPFDKAPVLYVDVRDAVYFLGSEFVEVV